MPFSFGRVSCSVRKDVRARAKVRVCAYYVCAVTRVFVFVCNKVAHKIIEYLFLLKTLPSKHIIDDFKQQVEIKVYPRNQQAAEFHF